MKIALIAVLQLFAITLFAQTSTYNGLVVDTENQPVPFVTINEVTTNNYTITSDDGSFRLETDLRNFCNTNFIHWFQKSNNFDCRRKFSSENTLRNRCRTIK